MGLSRLLFAFCVSSPQVLSQFSGNCDIEIGCGRATLGCSAKCPFGFPCGIAADCLSGSCTASYCDAGLPAGFKPLPALTTPPTPSSTNAPYASWSLMGSFSSLDSFKIFKDAYGKTNREFVKDPVGTDTVLRLRYPAGSFKPSSNPVGGTGFYAMPIDLSNARIVSFTYKIFFPTGFNFVKGGKLPGLIGGRPSCSGGDPAKDCFSTRYMFRTAGAGEVYAYIDQTNQLPLLCNLPPRTVCNPSNGVSIARGSFTFKPGQWQNMVQQITMNTPGKQDGKLRVFSDGKLVISFDYISWRNAETVKPLGIDFESFFGGGSSDWATPTEQFVFYKDFRLEAFS